MISKSTKRVEISEKKDCPISVDCWIDFLNNEMHISYWFFITLIFISFSIMYNFFTMHWIFSYIGLGIFLFFIKKFFHPLLSEISEIRNIEMRILTGNLSESKEILPVWKEFIKRRRRPKYDKWWKLKFQLLGIIPTVCPYCGGEITERGFEGHNRRIECVKCSQTLIDFTI